MGQEPKQVITEFLTLDEWANVKATTIRFFQQRSLPQRQIHAVTFDNKEGQQQRWLCIIIQDEQGHWRLQSAGPLGE